MSEAPQGNAANAVPVSNATVILRVILATLLLIPGVMGMLVLGFWVMIWANAGFTISSADRQWIPPFIIPSVVLISFSVLTVGIVLRFARWRRAPIVSLVLAIISVISIVLGCQLMLDSFAPGDSDGPTLTLVGSIVTLIVVSGPTFLHWWNAHRRAEPPRN